MFKYIIGIDEVGRGPLAGPVVVAAVAMTTKFKIRNAELRIKKKSKNSEFLILNSKLAKLRDSKKLSSKQREIWFNYVKKNPKIFYAVVSVPPKVIDRINISNAANLAATQAFIKLIKSRKLKAKSCSIFLDGGLYLKLRVKSHKLKVKTVIRGDEKIPAISLASIVAKVARDKFMEKLHKKYPRYGFDRHKGYGTKRHFKMIKKYGLSPIHRKSFNHLVL